MSRFGPPLHVQRPGPEDIQKEGVGFVQPREKTEDGGLGGWGMGEWASDCPLHLPQENHRKDRARLFSVVHAEKARANTCKS